jgi:asparagine synthase (glutamine-hydrolysing)
MCGIAGIVGRVDEANRAALRRMNDAMAHRGPDAQAVWESSPDAAGRGVLLAHRRLAILDLSPAGVQPMVDPVSGQVIVFNGEIYNYVELRDRLTAAGQTFGSTGDTAVMLRALALHGEEALPWLRGMYAFAQFDPARRTLLLARDPLGMKPLYLARNADPSAGWSFAFASEVRALLASGLLGAARLDPRAVASVVWNGYVVGPASAVQGVELLSPGHSLTVDARGAASPEREFWSLRRPEAGPPLTEEELAALLEEDVRLHLASDVPLAVFLSGGVDSSAVANLAQRAARTPIHTFTLAFEEEELNEGPFARRIARAIGTDHQEVLLTEADFTARLGPALDSIDQPTFDGVNAYILSHVIRAAGFTVALAGTGGDELFGGYHSFRDLPRLQRWARRLRLVPRGLLVAGARAATAGLRRSGGAIPPQTRWAKLPHMLARRDALLELYQLAYALFLPEFQDGLVGRGITEAVVDGLPSAFRARLAGETAGRTALSAISVLDQRLYLGERLLRDNDVASMAASLEQRVPLVDQVLQRAVDRLPDGPRFDPIGRKAILRRVGLRGLDPSLFEKPKTGFVLPFDRWIRRGLKARMDDALRDPGAVKTAGLDPDPVRRLWQAFLDGAPGVYWSRVWALYVHVHWCQKNGVRA